MVELGPTPPELTARLRKWLEYPSSSGAKVSADGRWVYHLSDRGGLPEAWRVSLGGGTSARIHPPGQRVGGVYPAPAGTEVVLAVDRGGNEHWQLHSLDGSSASEPGEPRALTHAPEVIHNPGEWRGEFHFLFTSNERDPRFFDVREIDVRNPSATRLLVSQDATLGVVAVRGSRVLVERNNSNLDSDLMVLDGERVTLLNPHTGEVSCFGADLSKEGVVAGTNPDREHTALFRYRTPGAAELLQEFPGGVEGVRVDPSGMRAAVTVNRDGWSELHLFDLATNEDRPLALPDPGVLSGVRWTPDGEDLVLDLNAPTTGCEVHRCELRTGEIHPVTHSPVPMPGAAPKRRLSEFTASDGLRVPYWELLPERRPPRGTVLFVHGGPEAQARPLFAPETSFLAGEGWRVIVPNVRGSTGYGRTYVHLDDVRRRMDSVRDLRDLVGALAASGAAVPGRVGILGGSYGGFMVLSAISTYPDLWGAAIDIVGIANFVTFLERTGPWRRKLREVEYGSLENDRDFLESISPIHHTDQMRTPLLVVHGANDPRVPVSEAEQIVAALAARGVPVEFLRYENEGHGLVRRENRLEATSRAAHFLAHYLDPIGNASPG